jgi:hypothetical protein
MNVSDNTREYEVNKLDNYKYDVRCMHETCPECDGTGIKKTGGFCVHGISCPCPKCSATC